MMTALSGEFQLIRGQCLLDRRVRTIQADSHDINTNEHRSQRRRNLLCGEIKYHGTTDSSYCCFLRNMMFSFLDTDSTKSSASAIVHGTKCQSTAAHSSAPNSI